MEEYKILYGKNGIEIGGPSTFFGGRVLDIYNNAKSIDGANFSTHTIWEGDIIEGETFKAGDKTGHQYICDATRLNKIESEKYDFVMSSNAFEHIANPLKALCEFLRILKPKGILLLVLPNKDTPNFDHRRSITKMQHLIDDFRNDVLEDDLTHLGEELLLHDLPMTPECGDRNFFMERSLRNFENRCLHQHVFDMDLLEQIFNYFSLSIIRQDTLSSTVSGDYIIMGSKKSLAQINEGEGRYLTDKGVIHDYLPIYEKLFSPLRFESINIFEVGYQYGGSCKLWEKYFPKAKIKSIDSKIEKLPPEIELLWKTNYLVDRFIQPDPFRITLDVIDINDITPAYFFDFLLDIAIDDGSHRIEDQVAFVKNVYPALRKGGILIIEDIQNIDTAIEFDKLEIPFELIDNREGKRYDEVLLIFRKL